jgi:hypothetical protein
MVRSLGYGCAVQGKESAMTSPVGEGVAVHPFRIDVSEEELVDLRRRIAAALTGFLAPYREGSGGGSR